MKGLIKNYSATLENEKLQKCLYLPCDCSGKIILCLLFTIFRKNNAMECKPKNNAFLS